LLYSRLPPRLQTEFNAKTRSASTINCQETSPASEVKTTYCNSSSLVMSSPCTTIQTLDLQLAVEKPTGQGGEKKTPLKLKTSEQAAIAERFVPQARKERLTNQLEYVQDATSSRRFTNTFVKQWTVITTEHSSYLEDSGLKRYNPLHRYDPSYDPSKSKPDDKHGFFVNLEMREKKSEEPTLSKIFEAASISCEEEEEDLKDRYKLQVGWNVSPGFQHKVQYEQKKLQKAYDKFYEDYISCRNQLKEKCDTKQNLHEKCKEVLGQCEHMVGTRNALLAILEGFPMLKYKLTEQQCSGSGSGGGSDTTKMKQRIEAQKSRLQHFEKIRAGFKDMKTILDEASKFLLQALAHMGTSSSEPAPSEDTEDKEAAKDTGVPKKRKHSDE
jgi:hypothetical protein